MPRYGRAVLVKRYTSETCGKCDQPLLWIDGVELGKVFEVDLDSRREGIIKLAHQWKGEVITLKSGEIMPTELLGFK